MTILSSRVLRISGFLLILFVLFVGAGVILLIQGKDVLDEGSGEPLFGGLNGKTGSSSEGKSLRVTSDPEDVSIYLDGSLMGRSTPIALDGVQPEFPHELRLEKSGYAAWHQQVFIPESARKPVSVHANLDPNPASLTLLFTPSPAILFWAGTIRVVKSPDHLKDVPPLRAHPLRLEAEGFYPESQQILLGPGENRTLRIDLQPMASLLSILSEPQGASLKVDGRPDGRKTPIYSMQVTPGRSYRFVLELPGYQPWETTFRAEAHSSETLRASLKPVSGGLRIHSTPWAEVYLDGERLGGTPFLSENIPSGTHLLQLRNPKRALSHEESIWIPPGNTVRKRFTFEGTLDLSRVFPGIEIFLDGKLIGRSPMGTRKLPVGRYELTLRDPRSGNDRRLWVHILQGKRIRVTPR